MSIAYLPLDSRPCNRLFPVQLLRAAGMDCVTPPDSVLDDFTTPGDTQAAAAFLRAEAGRCDTLIVSVDQLVYGSLLASRSDAAPLDAALRRLDLLHSLRAAFPKLRILAFSVIMRASISTLKQADLPYYDAFTQYSQVSHRVQAGDEAARDALEKWTAFLPGRLRAQYHRVRDRNHAVNRACIDLVADGTVDTLLLLQEDAQPFGFHRLEQAALRAHIDATGTADRVTLHNGADEGGCLCAARAAGKPRRVAVHVLGGRDGGFIAKYEDRPFLENLRSHAAFAGLTLAEEGAQMLLCVLPPYAAQEDVPPPEGIDASTRTWMEGAAAELAALCAEHPSVALLDVCYANGGAVPFLEAFARQADPLCLAGYAAWNTASNALGTLLGQLALQPEKGPDRGFTAERLLDDLLYQSVARFRLNEALRDVDEDIFHIGDMARANALLRDIMAETVRQSAVFSRQEIAYRVHLPWPRTFEAEVRVLSLA